MWTWWFLVKARWERGTGLRLISCRLRDGQANGRGFIPVGLVIIIERLQLAFVGVNFSPDGRLEIVVLVKIPIKHVTRDAWHGRHVNLRLNFEVDEICWVVELLESSANEILGFWFSQVPFSEKVFDQDGAVVTVEKVVRCIEAVDHAVAVYKAPSVGQLKFGVWPAPVIGN